MATSDISDSATKPLQSELVGDLSANRLFDNYVCCVLVIVVKVNFI